MSGYKEERDERFARLIAGNRDARPLAAAEELEYVARAQEEMRRPYPSPRPALDLLTRRHIGLMLSICHEYRVAGEQQGLQIPELFSIAAEGFCLTVAAFEPARRVRLVTPAGWNIRGAIHSAIRGARRARVRDDRETQERDWQERTITASPGVFEASFIDGLDDRQAMRKINAAFDHLDATERQIVEWRLIQEHPNDDDLGASLATPITRNTVIARRAKALRKLAKACAEEEPA